MTPRFILALRDGRSPTIHGSGRESRDFTHIDNVVASNLLAMDAPDAPGPVFFNIGCGHDHSLNELVEILNRPLDSVIEPIHGPPRRGDVERSWPDISRATQVLGNHPTVDFEQNLRRTLAAYEEDRRADHEPTIGGPRG